MSTPVKSTTVVDCIVKLKDIVRIDGRNPRTIFDKNALKELASQIKEAKGILTPLLTEKKNTAGQYPLVDGERRYRALTMLADEGLVFDVPVHIVSPKTNGEAIYQALISNDGMPLDLFDLARAVVSLVNDHGMDRKQVFLLLGMSNFCPRMYCINLVEESLERTV